MRTLRRLAICALLAAGGLLTAAGTHHLNMVFSEASFPDVAIQDARSALSLWGNELVRLARGMDSVTINILPNTRTVLDALKDGTADLAVISALDYLRAESVVKPDLGLMGQGGRSAPQRYLLVVGSTLKAGQLRDLRNARFAYVASDTSGLLFLNHALLREGLPEMDRFFATVETRPKGSQALNSIVFGLADAALVREDAFATVLAMNPRIGEKVRIFKRSEVLAANVAVYRRGYPQPQRRAIQEAVERLNENPRSSQLLCLFGTASVRPATEMDLETVRRLFAEYRQMKGRLL